MLGFVRKILGINKKTGKSAYHNAFLLGNDGMIKMINVGDPPPFEVYYFLADPPSKLSVEDICLEAGAVNRSQFQHRRFYLDRKVGKRFCYKEM